MRRRLLILAVLGVLHAAPAQAALTGLTLLGHFDTGLGTGAAEISAYDPVTGRLFTVNAAAGTVDVIAIGDPTAPSLVTTLDPPGGEINSVAIKNGVAAVAVAATTKTNPGLVAFYSTTTLALLGQVNVGALPDMVTFTPDGQRVLTANEGEPNSYGQADSVDPEGSVSIINIGGGIPAATVTTVGFADFNVGQPRNAELPATVRIFGPNASVAQDLEPEYIAISPDGTRAFVTLQENNAVAVINLQTNQVERIIALGFKDHSQAGNGLDPSDRDGPANAPSILIQNWPVMGLYQPDGIAVYQTGGNVFFVTANEGDARDYTGFAEEVRVSSVDLDDATFPTEATLKQNANLGRLTITRNLFSSTNTAVFTQIPVLGARSFTIWDAATGNRVFDSGDFFEQRTATQTPTFFNANNGNPADFDTRSDNKGPEPESVVVSRLGGSDYAFVALERAGGGVMVYDVSNPAAPNFLLYEPNATGDISPEGVVVIPPEQSPTGVPLLILSNEVSGTVAIYRIDGNFALAVPALSPYALALTASLLLGFGAARRRKS